MRHPERHHGRFRHLLRSLHRYVGLTVALVLLMLASTGIIINHSADLGLHQARVHAPWLLHYYGIRAPEPGAAFRAGRHWAVSLGERIYLDQIPLDGLSPPLRGAVQISGELVLIATAGQLAVLTLQGEWVDRLEADGALPAEPLGLAVNSQGLPVIRTAKGWFVGDAELLNWQAMEPAKGSVIDPGLVRWSRPGHLPGPQLQAVQRAYTGEGLDWERVLLDLHSGRLFGSQGPLFMDLAALGFCLLALSGIWIWARQRHHQRQRAKAHHRHHRAAPQPAPTTDPAPANPSGKQLNG